VLTNEQQPILLLIDDSPSIHRLLAFKLKHEGIEFLAAFSGQALSTELIKTHPGCWSWQKATSRMRA
jgi:DNA-binding response OmpR family regulator